MSTAGLFAVGVLVTLVWGAGISLLVYAAILDGREAERRKAHHHSEPKPPIARKPQVVADDTAADDDLPAAA